MVKKWINRDKTLSRMFIGEFCKMFRYFNSVEQLSMASAFYFAGCTFIIAKFLYC